MEENIYKKLIHNISSPFLLGKNNDIINNKNDSINHNHKNIKLLLNRKLSPLKTPNKIRLKKIVLSNKLFKKDMNLTRNINNNISKSCDLELSAEKANEDANKIMKKYYNPDIEKENEQSNELKEEVIDLNNMMTFYTKLKYKKEKEEIKKMMNKQRKITIFTSDNSNNTSSFQTLFTPFSKKTRRNSIRRSIRMDSNASYITNKNNSQISTNNFITLDVHKKVYKSPLHSLEVMKKNKIIYNSIIDDYNVNRFNSFKKLEKELGPLLSLKYDLSNKNHNKIKILPYIPNIPMMPNENFEIKEEENLDSKIGASNINEGLSFLNQGMPIYFSKFFYHRKKGEKYLLKISDLYFKKNSPESRSQFIFVKEGQDIILHGGYNISRKYNIWKFDSNEKSWTSIEPIGLINELRYAHTGVLYHRNLYIFGGKYFKGVNFGDIEIFNLDKKCWSFPKLESEKRIPLRRNHVSCSVGNTMFVHGGMTEEYLFLDDMYILNYKPLKWYDVDINNSDIKIPPLAFHSCCLVMPEVIVHNPKFNIYSMPDLGERGKNTNIKEKGIYIFGGKISNEGPINSNLYVIKIGIKPLEIVQIKTNGIPPCPRYDSSLNYYEKRNILIIHGGRSNIREEYENGLSDTFILDLFNLNWMQVDYFNNKYIISPRYFHQSIIDEGNLYIFGGMSGNSYIGSELLVIDLESNTKCLREKFILDHQKKKSVSEKKESNKKLKKYSSFAKKSKFSFLKFKK